MLRKASTMLHSFAIASSNLSFNNWLIRRISSRPHFPLLWPATHASVPTSTILLSTASSPSPRRPLSSSPIRYCLLPPNSVWAVQRREPNSVSSFVGLSSHSSPPFLPTCLTRSAKTVASPDAESCLTFQGAATQARSDLDTFARERDYASLWQAKTSLSEFYRQLGQDVCRSRTDTEDTAGPQAPPADLADAFHRLENYVHQLKDLQLERVQLSGIGYMKVSEENTEVFGMVVAGFSGCFAAGIHPIFILGTLAGLSISYQSRRTEMRKRAAKQRMEELNKVLAVRRQEVYAVVRQLKDNVERDRKKSWSVSVSSRG